ncbi:MAG TPA: hypothetical protein VLA58_10890 [Chitinophagaceae bacterium]|nr:hypothetical protein [Chitinophagaceae bacterium]
MMRFILSVLIILTAFSGYGQKLSGQWTGGFNSNGDMFGGGNEYVLELEVKGEDVSGYSYTYFNIAGKRCYVICRLSGSYEKASKSITVKEVEKVKSNTPPDFRDCLQIHYLTYMKSEGKEVLVGKWKSAKAEVPCGTGETELERKQLVKVVPQTTNPPVASKNNPPSVSKPPVAKSGSSAPKTSATKPPAAKTGTTTKPPLAKTGTTPPKTTATTKAPTRTPPKTSTATTKPTTQPPLKTKEPAVASTSPNKTQTIEKNLPSIEKPKAPSTISTGISRIDKRNKEIIKTIEVDSRSFRVDLYDNGQIDGDTISLYLNGKLMVSRQRLSTEPVTLKIMMTEDDNELIMYAENLGSIPPNTALMVVTVGDKRFEVNISSSEKTNGAVRFRYREQ